eukprot:m.210341 g.210341  ORF g.210341 m.210341 type:complete len:232 (+) comp22110_c1_seq6:1608-2303(+)
MAQRRVQLFYDVLSPYSWIAFEVLCRYQKEWALDLALRPFLLAGVMQATGNRPPGMVPAKGRYMAKDLKMNAQYYNVPLVMPKDAANVLFKKGSLRAQRLLTATQRDNPQLVEPLTRALWMRIWHNDEDITTEDSLTQACAAAGIAPQTAASLLQASTEDWAKDTLKATTQEAIDKGAFGAPTIFAGDGAMFFGSDRFPQLARHLNCSWYGPYPSPLLQDIESIVAGRAKL